MLSCAARATEYWAHAPAGAAELANAHRLRGIGHRIAGNYPAAITALNAAVALAVESVDLANAINDLAEAERLSGDLYAAERDFQTALRIATTIGYREAVAAYTGNLTAVALDRGDWLNAEALARNALVLSEKVERQQLIANNCRRLAEALVRQGKASDAMPYARRAVEIYTHLRSPDLEVARATLRECES